MWTEPNCWERLAETWDDKRYGSGMAWRELQAWTALVHLMAAHAEKSNELHWLSESGRELPSVSGKAVPASHQNRTSIYHISLSAHYCRFLEPITATDSCGGRGPGLASWLHHRPKYAPSLSKLPISGTHKAWWLWHGQCSQESRRAPHGAGEAKIPRPTFVREHF